jgi:hypothetical protein
LSRPIKFYNVSDVETDARPPGLEAFISKWEKSQAAEKSNGQSFINDLCTLLELPQPEVRGDAYIFERAVSSLYDDGTPRTYFIDLYRRGCFVLETKQGAYGNVAAEDAEEYSSTPRRRKVGHGIRNTGTWDTSMRKARGQAEDYVRALDPVKEGRPPFVIVVDVGYCFELWAEFSRTGGTYTPYPDPRSHRFHLADMRRKEIRDRLRAVWLDPMSLDPSRKSAKVTREVADRLATLAKSLEAAGHEPEKVAHFLMRCLFTMFAEDVGLLSANCFRDLLAFTLDDPDSFPHLMSEVWEKMNHGGYSASLRQKVARFNGGLFAEAEALPLSKAQISLLLEASKADWRDVEPAIFGTLLERALDPRERHRLGAHYTPRGYVERLVLPTVMEPLRGRWLGVEAEASSLAGQGKRDEALAKVRAFHRELCKVRVLDPACGTGNFLYVAMEHMKRLEGEVLRLAVDLGAPYRLEADQLTVDPSQFLGLEVNPRAAAIAELVLWIGYLQWHFRTYGDVQPPEPIIKDFHGIEERDALLVYDRKEPVTDAEGRPVTRWDGRTMKLHPATGLEVPDETARVPEVRYVNPRPAEWPEADFIVGNPPFIGAGLKRAALGSGYMEALGEAYPEVQDCSDFVMYWWEKAAMKVREGRAQRFGFIATNSLGQTFNRRVLERHMAATPPLSLAFAIPDHPWVEATDGAAVRIAMGVGREGKLPGVLGRVEREEETNGSERKVTLAFREGLINPDLSIGVDVTVAKSLKSNEGVSCPGVKLHGAGFIVTPDEAEKLGLGRTPGLDRHIRPYRNGRDLTATPRGVMVIDLFGLTAAEVRERFPEVYQWLLERVKPERDQNRRESRKKYWWLFGEPISTFRPALAGLTRYLSTAETAKHRVFVFLNTAILPDNKLIAIAVANAYFIGVLSSRLHVAWALAQGSRLGVGNDPVYVKTRCFETFPFPAATPAQAARIRELGERLDAHRKARQAAHPDLTLTGMYNVLEKLRAGEYLTVKEQTIHEQGLVSILKEIHDELDAAVAEAYGWPADLPEQDILARLVELNRQRAEEEKRGLVRWLRPEYQNPAGTTAEGLTLEVTATPREEAAAKAPWPKTMADQAQAVAGILSALKRPATPAQVARSFFKGQTKRVTEILETLDSLGQARKLDDGRYARTG